MATTIEQEMELDAVNPTNSNAYWSNYNSTWYRSVYRFARTGNPGPASGEAMMTWKTSIPKNLAGTPAWNIVLHHKNASGDQGAVLFEAEAEVLGSGDTPSAMTVIVPNTLIGVGVSGDHNISVLSSTNFDSLVPLTAGEVLFLKTRRIPHSGSGDTLTGHWDFIIPPLLRVDVV